MFKQANENKDKNAGFVDDKGQPLTAKKVEEEKNPNDVDLKAPIEYNDEHVKKIEDGRKAFLKIVRKQNIVKWIVAALAIGLLIFSWIYFIQRDFLKWLGFVLTGVCVAIIIAYYFIGKKFNDKKMGIYLKIFYGETNASVFANPKFSEVHGDVAGKIDNDDFNNAKLYKDVSTIGSRNVVKFKVKDANAKICDLAAQKTTLKQLEPLFIGKYLIADNKYTGEDPVFIYLPGNSRSLPPNNFDGVEKVVTTKKLVVYSNAKNYGSVFTNKVRNLVTSLITNNILVDCSISICKGHTYFALGYDDCLMVLPLQDKFNPIPLERFKKDMDIVADIIAELN
ncbi:MAG: hypothetical protein MJ206_00570 [Bacilli bacterium]|nr:hypothetical protein [Bacilli bacterium]